MENTGKQKTKAGYEYLLAYKITVPIYDYSVVFADRWISKFSRTKDQWEQAARSGTQNIPEGFTQQSLSGYIKLSGVARGSLEELLKDCLAFARQNKLQVWSEERAKREIGELGEIWEILRNNPYLPDNPHFPDLPSDREKALNLLITLINQANTLIDRLTESLKEKHTREGGFSEGLLRKRLEYRRKISLILFPLISLISLIPLISPSLAFAAATQATFTVSFWVKPQVSVVSKALAVKNTEIRFYTGADSKPVCQIHNGTDWQTGATSATALSLNTWQYVTCAYDRTNIKVFINGVQQGSQALALDVNDTTNNWRIGSDEGGTYGDLNGSIDDVQIYNYARSGKQIVQDMEAGHPAVSASGKTPVAYYKFDEGYGTVANNKGNGGSTLNGTFGTGSSAPSWSQNGKFGKALSFDGGDKVTSTITDPAYTNTVSLWINPATSIANKTLVTTSKLTTDNSSKPVYGGCTGTAISVDQWTHLVAISDGTGICKIFQNGKQTATGTTGVTFGTSVNIGAGSYSGLIDEFKLYNYALTEDEVKVEYNRGSALVLGSLSSGTGNTAPNNAASQEYCIPGDSTSCAAPVARWDFNEGIGTTAMDTSGNGNTGTLGASTAAPTWTTGKVGKGLKFDGSNDYVTAPDSIPAVNCTFSAWIKTASGLGSQTITAWEASDGVKYYKFSLNNSGKLEIAVRDTAGNSRSWTSDTAIENNIWQHVAASQEGINTPRISINGKESALTVSESGSPVKPTTSIPFAVGRRGGYSGYYFNGLIDQVQIFNYARTPAQIAWDYNRGGPILHYRMDECEGTTIHSATKPLNASLNGTLNVGATAPQTSAGTCTDGLSTSAWYNGASGKYNASLKYDGQDDYTQVTDTANLRFDANTADFSLFSWAKRTTTGTEYIISKEDADNDGYRLMFNSGNQVLCSEDATDVTSTSTITDTNWHLVGCTIDRDGSGKIYIDGRADGAAVSMGTDAMATTANIRIGTRSYTSTNYFNGQLDDVKIFNYALTATQVKELYNGGGVSFR